MQQDSTKSVFDCWTQLTNTGIWPREQRLSTVTTPLNDRLRVMTDDSILDQVGIITLLGFEAHSVISLRIATIALGGAHPKRKHKE